MSKTKICKVCNEEFPATDEYFHKNKGMADGTINTCKVCEKIAMRKYHELNKEKIAQQRKEYREKTKEHKHEVDKKYRLVHKEDAREYSKTYREKNREVLLKDKREYYYKHRERILSESKIDRQLNAEKYKLKSKKYAQSEHGKKAMAHIRQTRRARSEKLISTFDVKQWEKCINSFNNRCAYCGEEASLHQEHVIPVSKGGHYIKQNIVPACKHCNSSKHNYDMYTWFKKQSFFNEKRLKKIYQWTNIKNDIQQLSIL